MERDRERELENITAARLHQRDRNWEKNFGCVRIVRMENV